MPTVPNIGQLSQPSQNPLVQPSQADLLMAASSMPEIPELPKEEWEAWRNLPQKEGNVYAGKNHKDLSSMLENNPEGFIAHKENKNLKSLKDVDILSIPNDDVNLFVRRRPKPALVS